jgi:phasin family protein
MLNEFKDFVTEKTQDINERVQKMRAESTDSVREAVTGGAENIKALKSPVRQIARSSIKLTAISQTAMQNLIELQADVITAALSEAALRLERASRAENVVDLVRDQVELLAATRERMVEDAKRGVSIVKGAGKEILDVAANAYEKVVEEEVPEVKVVRRKGKRAVRKTTRARKAA